MDEGTELTITIRMNKPTARETEGDAK
jgi:hypothetical protein